MTVKSKTWGWYFIGFCAISFFLNSFGKQGNDTSIAFAYLARWIIYYILFCLVAYKDKRKKVGNLGRYLFIYSIAVLIIGLFQILVYSDMRVLSVLGWDDHYYRLVGNWLDPNFTGLLLVLGLLRVLGKIVKLGNKSRAVVIMAFLVGILLTYSRSSYAALLVGIIFLFRWQLGLLVGLCTALIIFCYAVFIPKPTGEGGNLLRMVSVEARIRSYNRGLEIFKTSPIYGVGFNYYKHAQEKLGYIPASTKVNIHSASGNDNSFIFVLATTGIVGLIAFAIFWGRLFIDGSQLVRASLVAISVHSMFNNSIFFPAVIIWLWLLIGSEKENRQTKDE